jgi:hypothetical protein
MQTRKRDKLLRRKCDDSERRHADGFSTVNLLVLSISKDHLELSESVHTHQDGIQVPVELWSWPTPDIKALLRKYF